MTLKQRAKQLKADIPAVFLALKSQKTPFCAKALAFVTVAYALAPIDLAINGHTHRFQFYETGRYGNLYPMLIGGGPSVKDATLVVLEKRGKSLRVKALDAAGSVLFERVW